MFIKHIKQNKLENKIFCYNIKSTIANTFRVKIT